MELFTIKELEAAVKTCNDEEVDLAGDVLNSPLFKKLGSLFMQKSLESTITGNLAKALGASLAMIQLGISIGRNQVTNELIKDIK